MLVEDTLGSLDLGCDPYTVMSLQIGSPAVRTVSRVRSLADGTYDDTRYLGARAVTVSLRLRNRSAACATVASPDMQTLIDRVTPYMNPRRRPTLMWQLPGSQQVRAMVVRGESWPTAVEGPKFPVLPLSWVCPTGEILAGDADGTLTEECVTINPAGDTEAGRHYDESWLADGTRGPYPFALPVGGRLINNPGTATAHWRLTIHGAVTTPEFQINGVTVVFNRNGGLDLPAGQNVVMDTRARTILLNGQADVSRYDRVNYEEWTWDSIKLQPGPNVVRYDGAVMGPGSSAVICWTPTYLA